MIEIMLPAFAECLVLVGIHSYFGIHVIKRGIIFVDLALAQIAALGATVAFLFGFAPGTSISYGFSLLFTFLGAAIFSLFRFRETPIPQEAIIGIVYALAAATAILVMDRAPQGAEHIKEMLTGHILWVRWSTILKAAAVYLAVGLFHFLFRHRFLLISNHPEKAAAMGLSVPFWDFLFYASFGIVITHSVSAAGVLMVFIFLVVPAVLSMMLTDRFWLQLVIGWSAGLLVSITGLVISYAADLPSGPTVVSTYGAVLVLVAAVRRGIRAGSSKASQPRAPGLPSGSDL
jgi:zinc/manganese transport system permease protein